MDRLLCGSTCSYLQMRADSSPVYFYICFHVIRTPTVPGWHHQIFMLTFFIYCVFTGGQRRRWTWTRWQLPWCWPVSPPAHWSGVHLSKSAVSVKTVEWLIKWKYPQISLQIQCALLVQIKTLALMYLSFPSLVREESLWKVNTKKCSSAWAGHLYVLPFADFSSPLGSYLVNTCGSLGW